MKTPKIITAENLKREEEIAAREMQREAAREMLTAIEAILQKPMGETPDEIAAYQRIAERLRKSIDDAGE